MNKKITKFEQDVYDACSKIPIGKVSTYGDISVYIKRPKSQRAVGNALNRNPFAPVIPCHRVVRGDGAIGGFAGGIKKKIGLLRAEGVAIDKARVVDLTNVRFEF